MHVQAVVYRLLFAAAPALTCAGYTLASPVRVAVRLEGAGGRATEAEVQLVARRIPGDAPAEVSEVRRKISAPGEATLDLTPGVAWSVSAEGPGYWSEQKTLLVGSDQQYLALHLWPTARVSGTLATREKAIPEQLTVTFWPAPQGEKTGVLPKGEVVCPVKGSEWNCELPAVALDLQIRAKGYISHYRWGLSLSPGATVQTGRLPLNRGASLVGWVRTADGKPPSAKSCRVFLSPRLAGPLSSGTDIARVESLKLSVSVNDRGFFQIEGAPPGGYRVTATQEGYSPARRDVEVIENTQAELREPLVLDRPRVLELVLDPPVDPWGKPWRVQLSEADDPGHSAARIADSVAPEDGHWVADGLAGGRYSLTLRTTSGARWLAERFDIDDVTSPRRVEIPVVPVRGSVKLGDRPLRATLHFGGEMGAVSIPLQSDDEGEFRGFLPREGGWKVTVEAEAPPVKRNLANVEVKRGAQAREARVEIRIPNARLSGHVVDEQGNPTDRALVSARPADRSEPAVQVLAQKGGFFELDGLPAGEISLFADAGPGLATDTVEVSISEDRETPGVVLVARRVIEIQGQVVSSSGAVAGAQLAARRVDTFSLLPAAFVTTDAEGRFRLRLPAGTREMSMIVFPPGFSMRFFRTAVPEARWLTVTVEQAGGTLRIEPRPLLPNHSRYLVHGGTASGVGLLVGAWGRVEKGESGSRMVLPSLESGDYSLCVAPDREEQALLAGMVSPDRCVRGYLPPFGELTLKIPVAK